MSELKCEPGENGYEEAMSELRDAEKQTLYGATCEFRDAWNNFVLEFAYSLGIHHVCSWLARMIRRLTP